VAQMAPALLAGFLTGGSGALLGVAGVTTGGGAYVQAREPGVGVGKALAFGGFQGGVEVATEFIPAHQMLKNVATKTPFIKSIVHLLASEIPGEEVATALQDLGEWAVLPANTQKTFADYLDERPSAAAATAISTIVAVGAQTAVTHGTVRVLEQLGAAARASTTIDRAPDQVGALVDQMTGGPLAVHLPVETFTEYFQSKNIDPATMAEQLTGDPMAYARAVETGVDLPVPMGRYLTQLAGTDHHAFFVNEARLAPEALNARETQALDQAVGAQVTAPPADIAPSAGRVRDAMLAELTQAGIPAATARVYAELHEQFFQASGARAGLDPFALFQRYGLRVRREGVTSPAAAALRVEEVPAPDVPAVDVSASVPRYDESPTQRTQRQRAHYAEVLAVVLRDARAVDPTVDLDVIRQEFASRRDRYESGAFEEADSGHNARTLLEAIAAAGGLSLHAERGGGMTGELRWVREGGLGPFGSFGGVRGVFRSHDPHPRAGIRTGIGIDDMVRLLSQ